MPAPAIVKKSTVGHARRHNKKLTKDVHLLVYLDYMAFLKMAADRAVQKTSQSGRYCINSKDTQWAVQEALQKFRGAL